MTIKEIEKKHQDMRVGLDNSRRAQLNLSTKIEDGRVERVCVGMATYSIKNIYNDYIEFKRPRIILVKRK